MRWNRKRGAVHVAAVAAAVVCAACAGCGDEPAGPDADPTPDAEPPPDMAHCLAYAPVTTIDAFPAQVDGDLAGAGADHEAPMTCDVVDAPFGVASAGADVVYRLDGLEPGADYIVRVDGDADLAFYVMTGCDASSACALFVDAETSAAEVGRFTAPADGAETWLVVDYYAGGTPASSGFTVELYAQECETAAACGDDTPVCQDWRCVGCASDFDCTDPALPLCDEDAATCEPGVGLCVGDDAGENGDDGPAGARPLAAGGAVAGAICNNPTYERDFYRFTVDDPGEHWTVTLSWAAAVDLDLIVYDERGDLVGMSFYEQPERIEMTYLPAGDYYVRIDSYATSNVSQAVPYTISATRITGGACTGIDDCAAEWRNQVFRGDCVGGACVRIDADGTRGPGERCDRASDCDDGSTCSSFYFVSDADTRMECGAYCGSDADCAGHGAGYVCTDYLTYNFCVQRCAEDAHCPTIPTSRPSTGPWVRFECDVTTGRCVPP